MIGIDDIKQKSKNKKLKFIEIRGFMDIWKKNY